MNLSLKALENYLNELNNPIAIILVGLPLSGKDTILKLPLFKAFKCISRDSLLVQVATTGADYRQAYASVDGKLIDKQFFKEIDRAVSEKVDVVINATHLRIKRRRKVRMRFEHTHYCIALVLPLISLEEFIYRNNLRNQLEGKSISQSVFEGLIDSYEPLSDTEGFDCIMNIQNTAHESI